MCLCVHVRDPSAAVVRCLWDRSWKQIQAPIHRRARNYLHHAPGPCMIQRMAVLRCAMSGAGGAGGALKPPPAVKPPGADPTGGGTAGADPKPKPKSKPKPGLQQWINFQPAI